MSHFNATKITCFLINESCFPLCSLLGWPAYFLQ
uniref:Uncharacterized protein n=1 Tax=Anguilla anguilla TaxID=7936 RepID=A0A0E9WFF0_ANGAN